MLSKPSPLHRSMSPPSATGIIPPHLGLLLRSRPNSAYQCLGVPLLAEVKVGRVLEGATSRRLASRALCRWQWMVITHKNADSTARPHRGRTIGGAIGASARFGNLTPALGEALRLNRMQALAPITISMRSTTVTKSWHPMTHPSCVGAA